jgi:hypothetical protein
LSSNSLPQAELPFFACKISLPRHFPPPTEGWSVKSSQIP